MEAPVPTDEPLLTREQAADILGVSVSTIRRRIEDGSLRAVRLGKLVRIEPADLREFRRRLTVAKNVEGPYIPDLLSGVH